MCVNSNVFSEFFSFGVNDLFILRDETFKYRIQRGQTETYKINNYLFFKNLKLAIKKRLSGGETNAYNIYPRKEISRIVKIQYKDYGEMTPKVLEAIEDEVNSISSKLKRGFEKLCIKLSKWGGSKERNLKHINAMFNPIIKNFKDGTPFTWGTYGHFKLENDPNKNENETKVGNEPNKNENENEIKEVPSEETNENEKLNEEKSNVINQFKFQIFDLRVKSFSTRQHKFCGHGNRFDEVLYFENLKEFVRNVFSCECYNEKTVLKNFCEGIYPEREIKRFVKPLFYDEITDIDFRIKINKEWYKETLIIKKKLTSNFNKLYKTFYKDRWLILKNLDEIFDPIINDYKKDGVFQLKENHPEINEKDQENEINENESNNELEVSSEETNNNNDKDQENETNENEDNNTIENPWLFIIKNAKLPEVEV